MFNREEGEWVQSVQMFTFTRIPDLLDQIGQD